MSPPDDWRRWRPAIWLAMLAVAVGIVVSLALGAAILGAAIGTAARIGSRRRRLRRGVSVTRTRRR